MQAFLHLLSLTAPLFLLVLGGYALIRWLRWGWVNFSSGGFFRKMGKAKIVTQPPPLPVKG